MSIQSGLTQDNECLILARAKTKADRVYTLRSVGYRVREGRVTHFSVDHKILKRARGFLCTVGTCSAYNSNGLKMLRGIK